MPNTIQLRGDRGKREEAFAVDATIKPGHYCYRDSNNKFARNVTAGRPGLLMIAIEDSLQGRGINDAYDIDSVVFTYIPEAGDLIYVRVPAGAAAIVIGDELYANNTGCFIKAGTGPVRLIAREALDNSAGGAEAFIKAEVANQ